MNDPNRFVTAIEKMSLFLDRAASVMCSILIGAMTLAVLTGVFFRYVLNLPLSWPEEVSRYLMIWGASVAISLGIRADEHVGLTVILDSLKSPAIRTLLRSIIFLLMFGFLGLMFTYSLSMVRDAKFMLTQALGISMFIPYLAVPFSMALAAMQLILTFIIRTAKGDEPSRAVVNIDI